MSRTLEQDRAKYSLEKVLGFKGKDGSSEYSTLVKKLPAMILNNGFGQALAFLLSRSEGKKDAASWLLYSQLQAWLVMRGIYQGDNLISALMDGERKSYMHAQQEALSLLTWMMKFTNAYLTEKGGDNHA